MKKNTWLIVGIVVLLVIAGILGWAIMNKSTSMNAPSGNTTNSTSATDETSSQNVTVDIQDSSFSPANIKIKKGTKVTWVNHDAIRHNAVADASNTANMPMQNDLLGQGQSYSFTFNATGTVAYHCAAHPSFMKGTIEVVE